MATLKDLQIRIGAVKSTSKITSAMKMVAAAKLKRAQNNIESARPYVLKLQNIMSKLSASVSDNYSHPLLRNAENIENICIIVISSDRGLCGSFNTNLFKDMKTIINEQFKEEYPNAKIKVLAVGNKATGFTEKEYGDELIATFPGVFDKLEFSSALDIAETVKKDYTDGKLDKVFLFFNEFINVIKQEPNLHQLLPIADLEAEETEETFQADYIYEPDQKLILDELLPRLIDISCWRSLLESNAAEQASRMMAMDNATKNAKELIEHLELVFNKARQAAITTEMLEIVSGAESLQNG